MPAEGVLLLLFLSCSSLWISKGVFLLYRNCVHINKRKYSICDANSLRKPYPFQIPSVKESFQRSVSLICIYLKIKRSADSNHSVKDNTLLHEIIFEALEWLPLGA